MKRLLKSWVFWAFVAGPAALAVLRYTYCHSRATVCSACFSERVESQWRFGVQGKWNWPLWPVSETLNETRVHLDGWMIQREHRWGWVITGSHALLINSDPEGLLARYESDAAFRAFMLAKRERGTLTREEFREALGLPLMGIGSMSAAACAQRRALFDPWRDEFERSLR